MGCCKSLFGGLFKLILILINIPLLLIGLALVFFGIMTAFFFSTLVSWFTTVLQGQSADVTKVILDFLLYLDDFAVGVGVSMLVCGIIIFFIAFLGGCGACCNSYCMMVTYTILMCIVAVGSLVTAIIFLVDSTILTSQIANEFLSTFKNSFDDPDNPARKGDTSNIDPKLLAYASVFRLLPCCGVNSYTDFANISTWNYVYDYGSEKVLARVPVMCCKERFVVNESAVAVWPYSHPGKNRELNTACIVNPVASNAYTEVGCISWLTSGMDSVFAWVIFGMAIAMMVIFFIAVAVTVMIKKKSRQGNGDYEMN